MMSTEMHWIKYIPGKHLGFARTGTSLHRQVYLVLRERLLAGALQPDEQLPAEPVLCEQFGVSRITLRRAVSDLADEGFLERLQGRGTFVRRRESVAPARTNGYVEDIRHLSSQSVVKLLELAELPVPAGVAARLQLMPDTKVQRSVRVRLHQDRPIVLLTAWVPLEWSHSITRADLENHSLHDLLCQRGVRTGHILQQIGAVLADPLQAERLQVEVGCALVVNDRLVHDSGGRPVEYVEMVLPPERSRMVFDTPAECVEQGSSGRIMHVGPTVVGAPPRKKGTFRR
jgi:GntR family transcriptional regulator